MFICETFLMGSTRTISKKGKWHQSSKKTWSLLQNNFRRTLELGRCNRILIMLKWNYLIYNAIKWIVERVNKSCCFSVKCKLNLVVSLTRKADPKLHRLWLAFDWRKLQQAVKRIKTRFWFLVISEKSTRCSLLLTSRNHLGMMVARLYQCFYKYKLV